MVSGDYSTHLLYLDKGFKKQQVNQKRHIKARTIRKRRLGVNNEPCKLLRYFLNQKST